MNDDEYKQLYLKYKTKYIYLKNNFKNNQIGGAVYIFNTKDDIKLSDSDGLDETQQKIFNKILEEIEKSNIKNVEEIIKKKKIKKKDAINAINVSIERVNLKSDLEKMDPNDGIEILYTKKDIINIIKNNTKINIDNAFFIFSYTITNIFYKKLPLLNIKSELLSKFNRYNAADYDKIHIFIFENIILLKEEIKQEIKTEDYIKGKKIFLDGFTKEISDERTKSKDDIPIIIKLYNFEKYYNELLQNIDNFLKNIDENNIHTLYENNIVTLYQICIKIEQLQNIIQSSFNFNFNFNTLIYKLYLTDKQSKLIKLIIYYNNHRNIQITGDKLIISIINIIIDRISDKYIDIITEKTRKGLFNYISKILTSALNDYYNEIKNIDVDIKIPINNYEEYLKETYKKVYEDICKKVHTKYSEILLYIYELNNQQVLPRVLYQDSNVCILNPELKEGVIIWGDFNMNNICVSGLKLTEQSQKEGAIKSHIFRAPYYNDTIDYSRITTEINSLYKRIEDLEKGKNRIFIRVDPDKTYVSLSEIKTEHRNNETDLHKSRRKLSEYLNIITTNKEKILSEEFIKFDPIKKIYNLYTSKIEIQKININSEILVDKPYLESFHFVHCELTK